MTTVGNINMKKCSECGKEIYPPSTDWVYKVKLSANKGYKWQCSYGCHKKAKSKKVDGRKRNGKNK